MTPEERAELLRLRVAVEDHERRIEALREALARGLMFSLYSAQALSRSDRVEKGEAQERALNLFEQILDLLDKVGTKDKGASGG